MSEQDGAARRGWFRCPVCAFRYGLEGAEKLFAAAAAAAGMASLALIAVFYHRLAR